MSDTFAITIVSIIAVSIIGMFFQRRAKDKCLCVFSDNLVTIEMKNNSVLRGKLSVESTGLEIVYDSPIKNSAGYEQASYILYKPEFVNIQTIIRYSDDLDEKLMELRKKEIEEICRSGSFHKTGRKIRSFVNTIRDSMMEIFNLFMGRMRATPVGGILTSQEKYITQARTQFAGQQTAFEPLLEKHMGQEVIVEVSKGEAIYKLTGLLREYTSEFVEIMDVDYKIKEGEPARNADLVIPRSLATIRHLSKKEG